MLSLRILTVDSYQCFPTKEYDACYSDFRGCEIYKVPVLRITGNTPAGQKGCLHVHGVFPYLSVRFKDVFPEVDANSCHKHIQQLALEIDKALNVADRKTKTSPQHIYNIQITQRICMYGYHEEEEDFLKIYFYNPLDVSRTEDILRSSKIMNKFIQPHEAHIPYFLQFLIDYNLFGMNFLNVSVFKFRASEENFTTALSPLRNQNSSQCDESDIANKVWDVNSLSSSQINSLQRETICELEADCCESAILNKRERTSNVGKNPGLLSIWEAEKDRRRIENDSSQITPVPTQERNHCFETESEVFFKERLARFLRKYDNSRTIKARDENDNPSITSPNGSPSNTSLKDMLEIPDANDDEIIQIFLGLAASYPKDDSLLGNKNDVSSSDEDDDKMELEMSLTIHDEFEFGSMVHSSCRNLDGSVLCNSISNHTDIEETNFIPQLDGAFDDEDSISHVPKLLKESDPISPESLGQSDFNDEPPILQPMEPLNGPNAALHKQSCMMRCKVSLERHDVFDRIDITKPIPLYIVEEISNQSSPKRSPSLAKIVYHSSDLSSCSKEICESNHNLLKNISTDKCDTITVKNAEKIDSMKQHKFTKKASNNQHKFRRKSHDSLLKDKLSSHKSKPHTVKKRTPTHELNSKTVSSVKEIPNSTLFSKSAHQICASFAHQAVDIPMQEKLLTESTSTVNDSAILPASHIKQEPLTPDSMEEDESTFLNGNLWEEEILKVRNFDNVSNCSNNEYPIQNDIKSNQEHSMKKTFNCLLNSYAPESEVYNTETEYILPVTGTSQSQNGKEPIKNQNLTESCSESSEVNLLLTAKRKMGNEIVRVTKLTCEDIKNYKCEPPQPFTQSKNCTTMSENSSIVTSAKKTDTSLKVKSKHHKSSSKHQKHDVKCNSKSKVTCNSKFIDPTKRHNKNLDKQAGEDKHFTSAKESSNSSKHQKIISMVNTAMVTDSLCDYDHVSISKDNSQNLNNSHAKSDKSSHHKLDKISIKPGKISKSSHHNERKSSCQIDSGEISVKNYSGSLASKYTKNSIPNPPSDVSLEIKQIHPPGASKNRSKAISSITIKKSDKNGFCYKNKNCITDEQINKTLTSNELSTNDTTGNSNYFPTTSNPLLQEKSKFKKLAPSKHLIDNSTHSSFPEKNKTKSFNLSSQITSSTNSPVKKDSLSAKKHRRHEKEIVACKFPPIKQLDNVQKKDNTSALNNESVNSSLKENSSKQVQNCHKPTSINLKQTYDVSNNPHVLSKNPIPLLKRFENINCVEFSNKKPIVEIRRLPSSLIAKYEKGSLPVTKKQESSKSESNDKCTSNHKKESFPREEFISANSFINTKDSKSNNVKKSESSPSKREKIKKCNFSKSCDSLSNISENSHNKMNKNGMKSIITESPQYPQTDTLSKISIKRNSFTKQSKNKDYSLCLNFNNSSSSDSYHLLEIKNSKSECNLPFAINNNKTKYSERCTVSHRKNVTDKEILQSQLKNNQNREFPLQKCASDTNLLSKKNTIENSQIKESNLQNRLDFEKPLERNSSIIAKKNSRHEKKFPPMFTPTAYNNLNKNDLPQVVIEDNLSRNIANKIDSRTSSSELKSVMKNGNDIEQVTQTKESIAVTTVFDTQDHNIPTLKDSSKRSKNVCNKVLNHYQNTNSSAVNISDNTKNFTDNKLTKNCLQVMSTFNSAQSSRLSLKLNKKQGTASNSKDSSQQNVKKKWMVDRMQFGESKFALKGRSRERVAEVLSDSRLRIKLGNPEDDHLCNQANKGSILRKNISSEIPSSTNSPEEMPSKTSSSTRGRKKKPHISPVLKYKNKFSTNSKMSNKNVLVTCEQKNQSKMPDLESPKKVNKSSSLTTLQFNNFDTSSHINNFKVGHLNNQTLEVKPPVASRHPRKCKEKSLKESKQLSSSGFSSKTSVDSDPYSSDDSVKIIDTVVVKQPRTKTRINPSTSKGRLPSLSPVSVSSSNLSLKSEEEALQSPTTGNLKMKFKFKTIPTRKNKTRIVVVDKKLEGVESESADSDSDDSVKEVFVSRPEVMRMKTLKRKNFSLESKLSSDESLKSPLKLPKESGRYESIEKRCVSPLKINLSPLGATCQEVEKIKTLTLQRNPNANDFNIYTIKKEVISDEECNNQASSITEKIVEPLKPRRGRPRKRVCSPVKAEKVTPSNSDISPLKNTSFPSDQYSPPPKIRILRTSATECSSEMYTALQNENDNSIKSKLITPVNNFFNGVVIKTEINSDDDNQQNKPAPKRRGRKPGKLNGRRSRSGSQSSIKIINEVSVDDDKVPIFPPSRIITRRESLRPRHEVKYFPPDQCSDDENGNARKSLRKRIRKHSAPGIMGSIPSKDSAVENKNKLVGVQFIPNPCKVSLKKLSPSVISTFTSETNENQDSDIEIISDTNQDINRDVLNNSYRNRNFDPYRLQHTNQIVDHFSLCDSSSSSVPLLSSEIADLKSTHSYLNNVQQPPHAKPMRSPSPDLTFGQSQQIDSLSEWSIQSTSNIDSSKQEIPNPDDLNSGYFSPINYNIPEPSLEPENVCNFSHTQSHSTYSHPTYSYGLDSTNECFNYISEHLNDTSRTFNNNDHNQTLTTSSATVHSNPTRTSVSNSNITNVNPYSLPCEHIKSPASPTKIKGLSKPSNSFDHEVCLRHPSYVTNTFPNRVSGLETNKNSSYTQILNSVDELTSNVNFHNRCDQPSNITSEHSFAVGNYKLNTSHKINNLAFPFSPDIRSQETTKSDYFTSHKTGSLNIDSSHDDSSFNITSEQVDISPSSDAFVMNDNVFSDNHSPNDTFHNSRVTTPLNTEDNLDSLTTENKKCMRRNIPESTSTSVITGFDKPFELRTFDLSEGMGMIENDAELHPYSISSMEEFYQDFRSSSSESRSYGPQDIIRVEENILSSNPVKLDSQELAVKSQEPIYQSSSEKIVERNHTSEQMCINQTTTVDGANIYELPFGINSISTDSQPINNELYYSNGSSTEHASFNFIPPVMIAAADEQVNYVFNNTSIIVDANAPVEHDCLNIVQPNVFVPSCSVDTISTNEEESTQQSIVPRQTGAKRDILSAALQECQLDEEFENELMEDSGKLIQSPETEQFKDKKCSLYAKVITESSSPGSFYMSQEPTQNSSPYSIDYQTNIQNDTLNCSRQNFSPQFKSCDTVIGQKHPNDSGVVETAAPSPQNTKHIHTLGIDSSVPKSVLCGVKQDISHNKKQPSAEIISHQMSSNLQSQSSPSMKSSPELFTETDTLFSPQFNQSSRSNYGNYTNNIGFSQQTFPPRVFDGQHHNDDALSRVPTNKNFKCDQMENSEYPNEFGVMKTEFSSPQNRKQLTDFNTEKNMLTAQRIFPFLGEHQPSADVNELQFKADSQCCELLKNQNNKDCFVQKDCNQPILSKQLLSNKNCENKSKFSNCNRDGNQKPASNSICQCSDKNSLESIVYSTYNGLKSPAEVAKGYKIFQNFEDEEGSCALNNTIQSFYGDATFCDLNSSAICENISIHSIKSPSVINGDATEVFSQNISEPCSQTKQDFSILKSPYFLTKIAYPLFKKSHHSELCRNKTIYMALEEPPKSEEVEEWIDVKSRRKDNFGGIDDLEETSECSDSSDCEKVENFINAKNQISNVSIFNLSPNKNIQSGESNLTSNLLYNDTLIAPDSQKKLNQINPPIPSSENLESTPCIIRSNKRNLSGDATISPIYKSDLFNSRMKTKKRLFSNSIIPAQKYLKRLDYKKSNADGNEKFLDEMCSNQNKSSSQIEVSTFNNSVSSNNVGGTKYKHEVQHITMMSLEVHVNTRNHLLPDPKFDCVAAIFYSIHNDASTNEQNVLGIIYVSSSFQNNIFTNILTDLKNGSNITSNPKNCHVFCVPEEIAMFDKLSSIVREWDPDIMIGYEIQMASWGYLIERASYLNLNLESMLSRFTVKKTQQPKLQQIETDPTIIDQTAELNNLKIPGRIILNVWRILRKEVNLNIYSFENVYFHILHRRTPTYTHEALTNWYQGIKKDRVVRYYILRVLGSIQMLEKLDIIHRTSELARLFGIQFYDVLSRGSQFRVESMMLRTAAPFLYVPVSPSPSQRERSRAPECIPLILEPESHFYNDPVVVLDFQSLYPSMIIAYNYCFSTCLGRMEHFGLNVPFEFGCTSLTIPPKLLCKLEKENNIHISPTGVAFVKASVRKGVLPLMLEEILNTRIMVKQSMKKYKNNGFLQKLLDAQQLGLKLIANVTYGYTAANFSGRMPCVEVADSIVGKGKETLERAIHLIENTPKWKAKVIYGDTDSLFILLPGRSKEDAFELGKEMSNAVTLANPKPVKLKFEKVYFPCVLQTKKRYVGYMYENIDQDKPIFDAKGIETVRRDTCPAAAKILKRSLKMLFETNDISSVQKYVQRQFSRILKGRVNMTDFIFAKEYRGMHNYRPGARVPALELTKKRLANDPRSEPRIGERVPYVVVYGFPGLPIIQLIREPIDLINDSNLRINAVYYITRVIIPPLQRVFSLLKIDVRAWYTSIAHKVSLNLRKIDEIDHHKETIPQYFVSQNCHCCTKFSTTSICETCSKDPQTTLITLAEKIGNLEKAVNQINQVCVSCAKSSSSGGQCVSIDCPVLFKLNLAKRDLSQAPYLKKLINPGVF